ncbi:MAG: 4Fe-4S ferredoxin [Planctomycetes bacterium DG_23]|nr:MAG: 4Fe-4S ferredoxin [Planctomycetes bacterium DG_23]
MAIKRVWIEEGCTLCGLCEDSCPEVFELGEENSQVKEDADLAANEECIRQAAEECPVEVIQFEED